MLGNSPGSAAFRCEKAGRKEKGPPEGRAVKKMYPCAQSCLRLAIYCP